MDIKKLEEKIDAVNKELSDARKLAISRGREILKQVFVEFFNENPDVTAVGWRQYTPYFNDGDPCEFRCYVDYAWFTNAKDYNNIENGCDYEGEDENVWINDMDYGDHNPDLIPKSLGDQIHKFRKLLIKIDDDVYLDLFGDHALVVADRSGFDVREYDHD